MLLPSSLRRLSQCIAMQHSKLAGLLNLLIPTWPLVKTSRNTMFPQLQADWESNRAT